jgi:hypothetical protein
VALDFRLLVPPAAVSVGSWLGVMVRLPVPVAPPAARLGERLLLTDALLLAESTEAVGARLADWEAVGESVPVGETEGEAEALPQAEAVLLTARLSVTVRLEDSVAEAQWEGEREASPAVGVEASAREAVGVVVTEMLGVRESVALVQAVGAALEEELLLALGVPVLLPVPLAPAAWLYVPPALPTPAPTVALRELVTQGEGLGEEDRHSVEEGESVGVPVPQALGLAETQAVRETVRVGVGVVLAPPLGVARSAGVAVTEALPVTVASRGVGVVPPTPPVAVAAAPRLAEEDREADSVGEREGEMVEESVAAPPGEPVTEAEALLQRVTEGEPVDEAPPLVVARALPLALGVPLRHCVSVGV